MSEYSITVEGGTSKRLLTAGKYCDRDIVVTATGGGGSGGDIDALIDGSITEVTSGVDAVGDYAFQSKTMLEKASFPNATSVGMDAFSGCTKLSEISIPRLTTIGKYAFTNCKALKQMDLSKVTTIEQYGLSQVGIVEATLSSFTAEFPANAFAGCGSLRTVVAPVAKGFAGNYAFNNCAELRTAIFPEAEGVLKNSTLSSCYQLTDCQIPKCTEIEKYAMSSCYRLVQMYLPCVTTIAENAYSSCYSMKALVLSNTEAVVTLANKNAFSSCYHILGKKASSWNPSGLKDGYFYVPAALLEDYKVATNWSTYATQFRALEDYTVDGTVTGKLDESKL